MMPLMNLIRKELIILFCSDFIYLFEYKKTTTMKISHGKYTRIIDLSFIFIEENDTYHFTNTYSIYQ